MAISKKTKSSSKEITFTLQRLMNEHPCNNGLVEALRFLQQKRSVRAPRKLWKLLDELRDWSHSSSRYDRPIEERDERAIRRDIRKIADDVVIVVKPKVFADQLLEVGDFFEYVDKLIKSKARNEFKRRAYQLLKEDLVEADRKIEDIERSLRWRREDAASYEKALKEKQDQIKLLEKELEECKKNIPRKKKYLPISQFDPFGVVAGDYDNYETISEEKKILVAEEMARALAA